MTNFISWGVSTATRGSSIAAVLSRGFEQPLEAVVAKAGKGDAYVIMPERSLKDIQALTSNLPLPLLMSEGNGPEGASPLVLVRADLP